MRVKLVKCPTNNFTFSFNTYILITFRILFSLLPCHTWNYHFIFLHFPVHSIFKEALRLRSFLTSAYSQNFLSLYSPASPPVTKIKFSHWSPTLWSVIVSIFMPFACLSDYNWPFNSVGLGATNPLSSWKSAYNFWLPQIFNY